MYSPRTDVQHAPAPPEPVVPGTINHAPDADLPQGARAHDARLDSDVQRYLGQGRGVVREEVVDGFELGVQRCLEWSQRRRAR